MPVQLTENTNTSGVDFSSLVNSNNRGDSEITAGTVGAINSELSSRMAKHLEDFKIVLNFSIFAALNTGERVIPELQGSPGILENELNARLGLQSVGVHRNPESELVKKAIVKHYKNLVFKRNPTRYAGESFVDSQSSESRCDIPVYRYFCFDIILRYHSNQINFSFFSIG